MKKLLTIVLSGLFIHGCTSNKVYENENFPTDEDWKPVNPAYFGKTEAQRIFEGNTIK